MNATSLAGAFTLTDAANQPIAGNLSYGSEQIVFAPAANLAHSMLYTARVSTAAADQAGNALGSSYVWTFTTEAAGDTTSPAVSATMPADGAGTVVVNTLVTGTFSEPIKAETVTSASFTLRDAANNPVAGSVSSDGFSATFSPAAALAVSTTYTAILTTAITDLAGNPLASNVVWHFTTTNTSDTTAPTVSSTNPAAGASGFAVDGVITATFSEPMDPATMVGANFSLKDGADNPVVGTVRYSGTTINFTPAVNLALASTYTATVGAGVTDIAGNALSGSLSWSFTTSASPPAGSLAWAKSAGGSSADIGHGVAVLVDGAAIVVGTFAGEATFGSGEGGQVTLTSSGGRAAFVAKYAANGSLVWAKRSDGAGDDEARAVAVLADGSALVTGYFSGSAVFGEGEANATTLVSAGGHDIFVSRYNADGTLAYARRAGGTDGSEEGRSIAVLADGSTFVTGIYSGDTSSGATFGSGEAAATTLASFGGPDIFVARYDATGGLVWAKRAGASSSCDCGDGIAVFADGSTVVTGYFPYAATFGIGEANQTTLQGNAYEMFVARYNANGTLAWARLLGGAAWSDHGHAVAALADGSTIIVGELESGAGFGFQDVAVAKYDASGNLLWTKRAGSTSSDAAYGVAALADGSALVVGTFYGSATFGAGEANQVTLVSAGGCDAFIARYNPDGSLMWAKRTAGSASTDYARSVAALADGTVLVTGQFGGTATFGAGEANQTQLSGAGAGDVFVARFNR